MGLLVEVIMGLLVDVVVDLLVDVVVGLIVVLLIVMGMGLVRVLGGVIGKLLVVASRVIVKGGGVTFQIFVELIALVVLVQVWVVVG
ncbi:unnamed protein product [Meloidogyne enterolobii]|uniref:Uncharacterized protein n=1 Tax=Meloidogyne enterolobii TaxID=390850 RepID=A0ACB0YJT1_MELEN